MPDADGILCPECGWTGESSALEQVEGDSRCPICAESVEFVE